MIWNGSLSYSSLTACIVDGFGPSEQNTTTVFITIGLHFFRLYSMPSPSPNRNGSRTAAAIKIQSAFRKHLTRRQNLLRKVSNLLSGNVRAQLRTAGLRIPTTIVNQKARAKHLANTASANARRRNSAIRHFGHVISLGGLTNNETKNNLAARLNLTRHQVNKLVSLGRSIQPYPNFSNTKFLRTLIQLVKMNPNTAKNYSFYALRQQSHPNNLFLVNPNTGRMSQAMLQHPSHFVKRPEFNPVQASMARGLRML